jgi:hypothetical protein
MRPDRSYPLRCVTTNNSESKSPTSSGLGSRNTYNKYNVIMSLFQVYESLLGE